MPHAPPLLLLSLPQGRSTLPPSASAICMPYRETAKTNGTAVGPAAHCWAKWHQWALLFRSGHSRQCGHGATIWKGCAPLCDPFMRASSERVQRVWWKPQRSPSSVTAKTPFCFRSSRRPQAMTTAEARALSEGSSERKRSMRITSKPSSLCERVTLSRREGNEE